MAVYAVRAGKGTTQEKEVATVLIGNAWFSSVRAAVAASQCNIEAIYQIKTNHRLFPKQFIEDTLKDIPGGTHVVLEGKHLDSPDLIAIGYQYNSKVTLYFVITKNAGSTKKGNPY